MGSNYTTLLLGEVLEDKGYIRGPFGSALKRPEMKSSGIPVYEQQHAIYDNRFFRFFIDNDKFNELKRFQVKTNDLIISCSGTVGKVSIINEDDPKGIISQALLILRANPDVILPLYLKYFFSWDYGYNSIISRSSGSVQVNIAKRDIIESISISLPDIQTQKRIVNILKCIDDKIALNAKINENLEQQAQALCEKWVSEHAESIIMRPLSEIAEINPDTYSPKEKWEFVNYLDTSSITNGVISEIQMIYPNTEKLPSRARRIIKANDIVYSTVRPTQFHFGIIGNPMENMLASTGFAVIRSKHTYISSPYLYHFLTSPFFIEKMQQLAEQSTSTFPSVKPSDIGNCMIPCADKEEMLEITEQVANMYAMVSANHQENRRLAKLRDTLLPKLMNGEIDVSAVKI